MKAHFAYICSGKLPTPPTSGNGQGVSKSVGGGQLTSGPPMNHAPPTPTESESSTVSDAVQSGRYTIIGCAQPTKASPMYLLQQLIKSDCLTVIGFRMCEILEFAIKLFDDQQLLIQQMLEILM